jgi:hypothetical protein
VQVRHLVHAINEVSTVIPGWDGENPVPLATGVCPPSMMLCFRIPLPTILKLAFVRSMCIASVEKLSCACRRVCGYRCC